MPAPKFAFGPAPPLAASGATAAAPTAGTSVVSIAAPPAGKYLVSVITRQTGTPDQASFSQNMVLRNGTTVIAKLPSAGTPGLVTELIDVPLDGSGTLNVVTGSVNAGAGAVYNACIAAARQTA